MKTKKLIELLQKEDPNGNCEVLIGNMDILPIIYSEAGYWDGRMRLAEYDKGSNFPNRIRVTSSGSKINLVPIDPEDQFIMSILDYQEEFDYDVEDGSKTYPFNHEHYRSLNTKICWLHVAESYCVWYFKDEQRKLKEEKTRQLIVDLKVKYATQAKEAQLFYVNNNLSGELKKSTLELINKIYEYAPLAVLGAITHGSDAIYVGAESIFKYEFSVSKPTLGFGGGKVKFIIRNNNKRDELEFNEESFKLFAESIEKYYESRAKEY